LQLLILRLQAQDVQELRLQLSQQTDVREKVLLQLRLGRHYAQDKAFAKALDYYEQALANGQRVLAPAEQVTVYQSIVSVCKPLKNYDRAFAAYQGILDLQQKLQDSTSQVTTLHEIATLYEKTGRSDEALRRYQALIPLYQRHNRPDAIVNAYNNIGFLYQRKADVRQSLQYFRKAEQLLDQCSQCLNPAEQTVLYLNIGSNYSALKEYITAHKYFVKALPLQKENPVKEAEIHTYLASNYVLSQRSGKAISSLEDAITLASRDAGHPEAGAVLLKCYSLLARVYEAEDFRAHLKYTRLYQQLKEDLIRKEQKFREESFASQLTAEQNENKLLTVITEKKKAELRNTQLEKSTQEKELLLTNRELDLLKRNQELQQAQLRNELLEKEKIAQVLRASEQRLEAENQKRYAVQQQLLAERIKAQSTRQQKALLASEKERASRLQQLQQVQTQGQLRLAVIMLLLMLLLLTAALFVHSHKARKALARQNKLIQEQHQEIKLKNQQITLQNEELTLRQNEVLLHSQNLFERNQELSQAQLIIEAQNDHLKRYNENLEQQVQERTRQLTDTNNELVKHNQQLEQFAYIVAHNLRGPVARLLGLTHIFDLPNTSEAERQMLVTKVQGEARALDGIIADLNVILQVKKGVENEVENINLEEKLANILTILRDEIAESGTRIITNFTEATQVNFVQPYLHSILYNLVSNALKYRSPDRQPVIEIKTAKVDAQTVCLTVTDNGLGMDLNKYGNNVFGLYKRFHFHKEGKGLGLYLVKTQIEALGGRISLTSSPGEGSTFFLYFNAPTSLPLVKLETAF
jgi:signal transduction histidine kinase